MDKADTLLMPYFITDKGKDCAGWATVKANGDVIGCHATKAGAIKQMVAVSLAEKMPPGGERALNEELEVGDWVFWDNAGHTEFGLITFVSTFGQVVDQLGNELIATQDKPLAKISIYLLDGTTLVGTDQWTVKSFAPLSKLDIDLNQINDMSQDHPENHPQDNPKDYSQEGYHDGNRALSQAVIVDIDDTLIHYDKPMQRVIDYVNALPGRKYIITGRMQSDHDRTVSQLREAGVEYSALFMKQVDEPTTIFKRRIATKLKKRFHISLAIDNDESNRSVFRSLGIPTLNPASIKENQDSQNRHLPGKHAQKSHGKKYGKGASTKYPGQWDKVSRPYVAHQEQKQLPDDTWIQQNNELSEREALAQSYEKFGYNDKPSVSTDEFEELKGKGAKIVYRGYEKSDQMSSEEMTAEFRNGDKHYVGNGYYGNGTYVTENRDTAIGYSMLESEPGGSVMAMAIRPEAKFIHESNIQTYLYDKGKEIGYEGDQFDFLQKDPSQVAIFLGFDGIIRQHNEIETHYIILNRSAVVVPEFNEFV